MLVLNTEKHSFGAILRCALLIIFFVSGISTNAQNFTPTSTYYLGSSADNSLRLSGDAGVVSTEYKAYQGAVYEPFNDTPPSESATDGPSKISSRQNTWGGGGMGDNENDDPGHRDPGSPIGEPWIMLAFAAMAAIAIALRKKQTA